MKRKLLFQNNKSAENQKEEVHEEYIDGRPELEQTEHNMYTGFLHTSTLDGNFRQKEVTGVSDPTRIQDSHSVYET